MHKTLVRLVFTLCLLACVGCQGTVRSMIYPAPKRGIVPVVEKGVDTLVELPNDARIVRAVFTKKPGKLVVFFHGNGCTIACDAPTAQVFVKKGYSTLLVEYPGYGISAKYETTEKNIYSDAAAVVRHVQKLLGINNRDTILYGQSLGSGVAIEMARQGVGAKLILISPFTSIIDVAAVHYPRFLSRMLIDDVYDNAEKANFIDLPVLIIHGKKDTIIPHDMGQSLSEIFLDAQLITLPDANHNDIYDFFTDAVWKSIFDFAELRFCCQR